MPYPPFLPVPMKSDNRDSPPILHYIVVATTRMNSVIINEAFAKLLRRATSLIKHSLSKDLDGSICVQSFTCQIAHIRLQVFEDLVTLVME